MSKFVAMFSSRRAHLLHLVLVVVALASLAGYAAYRYTRPEVIEFPEQGIREVCRNGNKVEERMAYGPSTRFERVREKLCADSIFAESNIYGFDPSNGRLLYVGRSKHYHIESWEYYVKPPASDPETAGLVRGLCDGRFREILPNLKEVHHYPCSQYDGPATCQVGARIASRQAGKVKAKPGLNIISIGDLPRYGIQCLNKDGSADGEIREFIRMLAFDGTPTDSWLDLSIFKGLE